MTPCVEAIKEGKKTYLGKPCIKCYGRERNIGSFTCVKCIGEYRESYKRKKVSSQTGRILEVAQICLDEAESEARYWKRFIEDLNDLKITDEELN